MKFRYLLGIPGVGSLSRLYCVYHVLPEVWRTLSEYGAHHRGAFRWVFQKFRSVTPY